MNENSEGIALQNMNATQKVLGISIISALILLLGVTLVLQKSEKWWFNSLKNSAVKQSHSLRRFVVPMAEKNNAQTRKDFEDAGIQAVIVQSQQILLSSNKTLKNGATLNTLPESKDTVITQGDEVIWFIWDAQFKGHVGVIFSNKELRETKAYLNVILLLFVGICAIGSVVISRHILKREITEPLKAIAQNLDLMAAGHLESLTNDISALGTQWSGRHRHELYTLAKALHSLHGSLINVTERAKAIANDDLTNPLLDGGSPGDLSGALTQILDLERGLADGLSRLALGDFAFEPAAQLKPEGSLGLTFFQMRDGVQLLLDRLSRASRHLRTSAADLQESSAAQASAATKQADGVTETMATMEELAASSGHIADTAKHVVVIAEQTLENAREGQDAVENVGQGMEDIVKASMRGAERLFKLDEKSRSISRVATLIANVAEQSKILALNAAIEAAHAGEAGRGFSVVAEEVRNLANSVFESTRDIENLINEIQGEIRTAVQASEEEVKRANKGRDLAQDAQETIVHIFSSAENMTQAAHQIELATNQQRSASGQVATAVREMATSADQVAKGAKTVRLSLDDLGNLAQDLREIVSHFEGSPANGNGSSHSEG
jgi:methyl-accepting chemotaxis protein